MANPTVQQAGARPSAYFCRHLAEHATATGASFGEALALIREASTSLSGRELSDEELATFTELWAEAQTAINIRDALVDPLTGLYTYAFFAERVREIYLDDRQRQFGFVTCRLPGSVHRISRLTVAIAVAHGLKQLAAPLPAAVCESGGFIALSHREGVARLSAAVTSMVANLAARYNLPTIHAEVSVADLPASFGQFAGQGRRR
jgi:hypothetical protein